MVTSDLHGEEEQRVKLEQHLKEGTSGGMLFVPGGPTWMERMRTIRAVRRVGRIHLNEFAVAHEVSCTSWARAYYLNREWYHQA